MSKKYIDLHVHSNCSDGTFTPTELVDYALKKKLAAIALTDHDTIDGLPEIFAAAEGSGLEVIGGIEFSTEFHGKDVHIVGLDFDYRMPEFCRQLTRFQNSRDIRNEKMISRLREEGIDITWEAMMQEYPDAVWTRAHFGKFLLEHGYVPDIKEAFSRYLADDACCFIPREKVTPVQAVELIRLANGIPVLAHPMLYHLDDASMDELIESLKAVGLTGIEGFYSTYSRADEEYVRMMADRHQLLLSGGSDFHGSTKPDIDLGTGKGNLKIPYELLTKLREAKG
ncbi:MAG: PHP domain-containing protein [Blautia sp.]|nr:PHP domain-containing protein [Blautia sp.]MDY4516724.1 PHP domain-containing protein [Lachnospiraceae bacterium]